MKINSLNILYLGTDLFLKNRHHDFILVTVIKFFFFYSITHSNTKKIIFFHLKLRRMITIYNS